MRCKQGQLGRQEDVWLGEGKEAAKGEIDRYNRRARRNVCHRERSRCTRRCCLVGRCKEMLQANRFKLLLQENGERAKVTGLAPQ